MDLRDHIEAVEESGHEVSRCPACGFPLQLFEKAKKELGMFGYTITDSKTAWKRPWTPY
jgi:hypothetical protein